MSMRVVGGEELKRQLSQRRPYLMVDRAQVEAGSNRATGIKNISANEPYFCGHFPLQPILPGVLQVEAMVQLGLVALAETGHRWPGRPFLRLAQRVKFRKPVVPGDQLQISVQFALAASGELQVTGTTRTAEGVTCEATLVVGPPPDPATWQPRELTPAPPPIFQGQPSQANLNMIWHVLPHRFPFLLIDRVLPAPPSAAGNSRLLAIKNVTLNEPYFEGLDQPLLPDFLQLEIPAQTGCAHVLSRPEYAGKIGYFMAIDEARLLRPVMAGDQLLMEVELLSMKERAGRGHSWAYVGTELAAETEFKFAIVPAEGRGGS